jgi:hypothetical protein
MDLRITRQISALTAMREIQLYQWLLSHLGHSG